MDSFFITLPSNVKNEYFQNSVANYKTKLATNVQVDENWKVGLASISYTKSWKRETEPTNFEIAGFKDHMRIIIEDPSFHFDLSNYPNVEELIKDINRRIEVYEKGREGWNFPRVYINEKTNRVEILSTFYQNGLIQLKMKENLCRVLGIDFFDLNKFIDDRHTESLTLWNSIGVAKQWKDIVDKTPWIPPKPKFDDLLYSAGNPYNIFPNYSTLFLYCNLVKQSFVGDIAAPIMRIVEVNPNLKFRDQVLYNFTNIHHLPLQITEFDTIEIHIKDDLNRTIPFQFGRTIVTLHFKKT